MSPVYLGIDIFLNTLRDFLESLTLSFAILTYAYLIVSIYFLVSMVYSKQFMLFLFVLWFFFLSNQSNTYSLTKNAREFF